MASVAYWYGYTYTYLPETKSLEQVFIFDGTNIGTTIDDPDTCDTCFEKVRHRMSPVRSETNI